MPRQRARPTVPSSPGICAQDWLARCLCSRNNNTVHRRLALDAFKLAFGRLDEKRRSHRVVDIEVSLACRCTVWTCRRPQGIIELCTIVAAGG